MSNEKNFEEVENSILNFLGYGSGNLLDDAAIEAIGVRTIAYRVFSKTHGENVTNDKIESELKAEYGKDYKKSIHHLLKLHHNKWMKIDDYILNDREQMRKRMSNYTFNKIFKNQQNA